MEKEIVVLSGVRTPIGEFGGSLKDLPPIDLGTMAVKEAIRRASVEAAKIGHLVLGNVIHTETRDLYISRVVALNSGLTHDSCAFNVNRLCGSGFQAIVSAAQMIQLGEEELAVAAGAESMSRGGYLLPAARWGARMGDSKMVDMMVGALTDPFGGEHMGMTAENVAARWKLSREDQDKFSVESHKRAAEATAKGYFKDQILPVELKSKKGAVLFSTDEHVRADVSMEGLAKLRAVFKKDGSVTAGNASGINDGAAAVVLMEGKTAQKANLKPLARLASYAIAGVDPNYMGEGPIPAVKKALSRAGLKAQDIDVVESNEAFAAQAMCVTKGLELNPSLVNPNGGAVALGHPIGATGTILTVKCLYELIRTNKKYGLVTMCIGGGQGIAGIFERL